MQPDTSPWRRRWRRIVVALALTASLGGVVAGYGDSRLLAWQMFPEASRWQADVVRITADGGRHAVEAPWPGGYRWEELVTESGLSHPGTESHAAYGVDFTLRSLQHALDWVAQHTPADDETAYLEARVRYRHNDDPWRMVILRSADREGV